MVFCCGKTIIAERYTYYPKGKSTCSDAGAFLFYFEVKASFSSFFSDAFINRAGNAGHLSHCMKELKTAVSAKLLHGVILHFERR